MSSVTVTTPDGSAAGTVDLPGTVFAAALNVPLIHQVVVAQLAAARQGTASTRTRGEVSGTGRKPYKQKGTGRARQGSLRGPQFEAGGVAHGPKPRTYGQRTPKKMKAAALRSVLSDRAGEGRVHVVTRIVDGDRPSTRQARETLARLVAGRPRTLVVLCAAQEADWLSLRNLVGVNVLDEGQLNAYDVVVSDDVVFTQAALDAFIARQRGVATASDAPGTTGGES